MQTTTNSCPTARICALTHPSDATSVQISARELFAALRIDVADDAILDREVFTTRRFSEGDAVFRAGDEFHSLYVVRSGFFKTILLDESGTEKVLDFAMKNDLIGADGLASGKYASEAIALEGSEVIIVPFSRITALTRTCRGLERSVYSLLSRALVFDQGLLYVLAMLSAEGRVAAFLLNLADRFGKLGYARSSFLLRMTRQEIGSYLGLKLETVSRAFSAFDAAGLIKVNLKQIDILDPVGLHRAMNEPVTTARKAVTEHRAQTIAPKRRPVASHQPAFA